MYSASVNKLTFTHEEAKECVSLILEELQSDQVTIQVLFLFFSFNIFFLYLASF